MSADRFYNSLKNATEINERDLVSFFVYHLTVELGHRVATSKAVGECFAACDLTIPKRLSSYLSEGVTNKPQRYVKVLTGYRLQKQFGNEISEGLGSARTVTQTSVELRKLEHSLPEGPKKNFLTEMIDCFEISANRAAIVMCWMLTVDHMFDHVFNRKLVQFNIALAANPQGKLKCINSRDDLSELKEGKFIELCRTALIISNDVRKILEDALGARNSCAHPSNIVVPRSKVIALIEDLIQNVVLKYDD
ncbi:hypothetical protein [Phyllobacterium meliloti]|uniref:hypothetical protein n=1 Tax=Phyllobacterium meliloti TaxID=555317 RepID=UPI001D15C55F|nr:hypothetical protein [Phyllobacterium sp. T1293]UGX85519.1 hypothetical protein LLE53_013785 [Phyllobacterium sp. T1293]